MVCHDGGGILDDIFVYRTGEREFLLCVNASNRQKVADWLCRQHRPDDRCAVEDRTVAIAQIAIQGPRSRDILAALVGKEIESLKLHHSREGFVAGIPCFIARTGYTGELGYEINVPSAQAAVLWEQLLEAGRPQGIKPAGLGARDLLRLEMGYLLYGNDINEETTPLEASVEWTVSFQKGEFVGSKALLEQEQAGAARRLVGFELLEKAVPRHGFKVLSTQSEIIGEVTSGNLSPLLQKGIGMAYVPSQFSKPDTAVFVDIRGKSVPAQIVKPPFYKKPKS
jgi:aminomethyltransferase